MIYVGTCGFSYKDWVGPFYPSGIKPAAMLEYYAQRFGAVEIDSTYYAIPKPALFESMAKRTPQRFRFTVKAPGSITHAPAGATPEPRDIEDFRQAVNPLVSAGKLAAVLAQFPSSFKPGVDACRRLESLREAWPALPMVAEFRNRDWQRDEYLAWLRSLGVGWCNVDEPRFRQLMRPGAEATSPVGYVRFHGRNAAKWWKQEKTSAERYDFLYSTEQLVDWLPLVAEVEASTKETYVFFNNHRNGQATINARQMKRLLNIEDADPGPQTQDDPRISLLDGGN